MLHCLCATLMLVHTSLLPQEEPDKKVKGIIERALIEQQPQSHPGPNRRG